MSAEFAEYLVELLAPLGQVSARRMFGGHGLFLDGLMFAIVVDDTLWLKADGENRGAFEALGLPQFSYARQGRRATLGFFRPPDETLDSPALLLPWARGACAAALRAQAQKASRKRRTVP